MTAKPDFDTVIEMQGKQYNAVDKMPVMFEPYAIWKVDGTGWMPFLSYDYQTCWQEYALKELKTTAP